MILAGRKATITINGVAFAASSWSVKPPAPPSPEEELPSLTEATITLTGTWGAPGLPENGKSPGGHRDV